MKILTRSVLDKMGCSNPDCTEEHSTLFFHSLCCEDRRGNEAPLQPSYEKATGLLTLSCVGCGEPVAVMQIAADAQTVLELH
jgi:hypothetical protein